MKKLFTLFLFMTAFSFCAFSQTPSDEQPADPGGDVENYENGYCEGALAAADLLTALAGDYNGFVDFIEWHAFDSQYPQNLGPVVDYFDAGYKIPVVKWDEIPSESIWNDHNAMSALRMLEDNARNGGLYANGFYEGFADYYYAPF